MAHFSAKKIAIDKANAVIFISVAISTFVVVFSLVASRALYSQMRYQSKVSSKKEQALKTLQGNLLTVEELTNSYRAFADETTNILGGNPEGDADRDGDNSRIVLDALPSVYDFPAMTTSIEKLLQDNGFAISSITGSDEEIAQSGAGDSENPEPVEMPFSVEVVTSDQRAKTMLQLFERSIRPMQVNKLILESQSGDLKITVTGKTYYQPVKNLNISSEIVR